MGSGNLEISANSNLVGYADENRNLPGKPSAAEKPLLGIENYIPNTADITVKLTIDNQKWTERLKN